MVIRSAAAPADCPLLVTAPPAQLLHPAFFSRGQERWPSSRAAVRHRRSMMSIADQVGVVANGYVPSSPLAGTEIWGLNVSGGGTLVLGQGQPLRWRHDNLLKTTVVVTNNSSVGTGAVTLDGGVFKAGADGLAFSNSFLLTATAGNTIDTNGNTLTLSGVIGDAGGSPGALTKAGTGTLILSGVNTCSGGTTINAGTLQLTGAGTLGEHHRCHHCCGRHARSRRHDANSKRRGDVDKRRHHQRHAVVVRWVRRSGGHHRRHSRRQRRTDQERHGHGDAVGRQHLYRRDHDQRGHAEDRRRRHAGRHQCRHHCCGWHARSRRHDADPERRRHIDGRRHHQWHAVVVRHVRCSSRQHRRHARGQRCL